MAEVDFSDVESATAWFETQSVERRCAMASRAALRVVATIGQYDGADKDRLVLAVLHAILTSAGRGLGRPADVEVLERSAARSALSADSALSAARSALSADSALSAARSAASALSAARSARSAASALSAARSALSADSALSAARSAASAALSAVSTDADLSIGALTQEPVWPEDVPAALAKAHEAFRIYLGSDPDWSFWRRWYEQMWAGTFRDWDLAIAVATLPDALWQGEDALAKVAEAIRGIEHRRLSGDIVAFKETSERIPTAAAAVSRWHNNPPEVIEDPVISERLVVVWAALDDLKDQADAPKPDLEKARGALSEIKHWFLAACHYVGRKADLAVDAAIRWAVPIGGGYLLMHPEKMQTIIRLAERLFAP